MQGSSATSPSGLKLSRRQEWGKYILITVGLGFLGLVVVLPLLAVFYQAFSAGWDPFWQGITDPNTVHAMGLTLRVAAVAVPINTAFGILMAWILARHRFPGKALVLNLLDLPLAISPVIGGLMFILLYSPRFGLLQEMVNQMNWRIVFAYPGILLTTIARAVDRGGIRLGTFSLVFSGGDPAGLQAGGFRQWGRASGALWRRSAGDGSVWGQRGANRDPIAEFDQAGCEQSVASQTYLGHHRRMAGGSRINKENLFSCFGMHSNQGI